MYTRTSEGSDNWQKETFKEISCEKCFIWLKKDSEAVPEKSTCQSAMEIPQ